MGAKHMYSKSMKDDEGDSWSPSQLEVRDSLATPKFTLRLFVDIPVKKRFLLYHDDIKLI